VTKLIPPRFEGTIELSDGRRLGFAEYGRTTAPPLFWFHGTPGGRRQIPPHARRLAAAGKVRIIAVERPGIGSSTPHLHDNFAAWAEDVEQLADALALENFAVVGLSGGGPYTLACAHELPDRVVAAAVLGGVAPSVGPEAPEGGIIAMTPWASPLVALARAPLGRAMSGLNKLLRPVADEATDLFLRLLPPGDRRVFEDPLVREMFHNDIIHCGDRQMQAMFIDMVLFGRHWGFALRDIQVPVRFWHGDADNIIPLEHGEHMANLVPDSELRIRPEEGHLGMLGAAEEIFDELLSHWPENRTDDGKATNGKGTKRRARRR
jgi:pimeloyl-ACP methyl ester carboxylesterase